MPSYRQLLIMHMLLIMQLRGGNWSQSTELDLLLIEEDLLLIPIQNLTINTYQNQQSSLKECKDQQPNMD